ncbi:MAG: hypothetical protein FJW20_07055 [Acidimicrobiia bacterium]|nr:hypothetical protein [Acidimicrobiia bacterium]
MTRSNRSRKGSFITEFAIVAPFLVMLLAGGYTIGMSLTRTLVAGQLCRNANVLNVRGIDLSQPASKRALLRTAPGLNMTLPGSWDPDPNGKGAVIITKVIRVGPNTCNLGIPGWDQNPGSCPNYDRYVIASRIVIGNTTRWQSATGQPSSVPGANGNLTDWQVATVTGNQALGFPGIIALNLDEFSLLAETFADISNLDLFSFLKTPVIAVRNLS